MRRKRSLSLKFSAGFLSYVRLAASDWSSNKVTWFIKSRFLPLKQKDEVIGKRPPKGNQKFLRRHNFVSWNGGDVGGAKWVSLRRLVIHVIHASPWAPQGLQRLRAAASQGRHLDYRKAAGPLNIYSLLVELVFRYEASIRVVKPRAQRTFAGVNNFLDDRYTDWREISAVGDETTLKRKTKNRRYAWALPGQYQY